MEFGKRCGDGEDILDSIGTDSSNSDWEECDQSGDCSVVKCLFCVETFRSSDETFNHCQLCHGFDIKQLKSVLRLDCFSYIRLINFLRAQQWTGMPGPHENEELLQALTNDCYMKPVDENDVLLMYDIDDVDGNVDFSCSDDKVLCKGKNQSINDDDYQVVLKKLLENEAKLKETEEQLQITRHQIAKMKEFIIECLEDSQFNDSKAASAADDDGYFRSYAHFSIHQEMLQDEVRTMSYRDAILGNEQLFRDKVVLDVGCGTGILSLFAARAGAATVIGVDESEIVYQAMDIINENDMKSQITILKGRMEDVEMPKSSVDVIVSEWMGYFLLFECMLETVIKARDKYLAPGGHLLPNRCDLRLAGVSDLEQHGKMVSFWDDVYGFKMSCLKGDVVREAAVAKVDGCKLISEACIVHELDLMTCTSASLSFTKSFQLVLTNDGPLTAIVAWFDTYFDLPNKISFSTSPTDTVTHWKQTIFYLREPLAYPKGSCVSGNIRCTRPGHGPRLLKIEITIGEYQQEYILQ